MSATGAVPDGYQGTLNQTAMAAAERYHRFQSSQLRLLGPVATPNQTCEHRF